MSQTAKKIPNHIAIIMDGNGRWAKAQGKPRLFGHKQGVETVKRIVEDVADIGVKCLTLYSFSTENWSRPKAEIAALFGLLKRFIHDDLQTLIDRNVRVRIIGSKKGLSQDICKLLDQVETRTKGNTEFNLIIAFNYGGRDEIIRATKKFAKQVENEQAKIDDLDDEFFSSLLDTHGIADPDLVIRTSGEYRISNFLLWQAAYAEFVFTDVLWPDFSRKDLIAAIDEYQNRERRFGNITPQEVA